MHSMTDTSHEKDTSNQELTGTLVSRRGVDVCETRFHRLLVELPDGDRVSFVVLPEGDPGFDLGTGRRYRFTGVAWWTPEPSPSDPTDPIRAVVDQLDADPPVGVLAADASIRAAGDDQPHETG